MLSKDKLGILLGEVWVDIPIDYLRETAAMEEAFDQGWSKGYDDGYSQREEDEIFEAKN
jgi:hypothetical protein